MKLISKEEYLILNADIQEFVNLCNENNYIPTKSDFKDIIEFILESEDKLSNINESYESNSNFIVESLYDSFELNEVKFKGDNEYDNAEDFKTATGMVKNIANKTAMIAGGAALAGVAGTGIFVQWLFKKGKVKKLVSKELDSELDKLKGYQKLADLKNKLAELKGEEVGKIEFPTMAEGPELEAIPKKDE